jgi:hypothetical protein
MGRSQHTLQKTMSPQDSRSPCAADALFSVTPLTVNGKTVGVLRLCDTIAEVRQLELREDKRIREALIECVEYSNFIPHPLRDAYADALLAYYRATEKKDPAGGT